MRLTNYIRERICQAMLNKRFNAEEPPKSEEHAIAVACYERLFSKEDRALMESLPEGWLQLSYWMNVTFYGRAPQLRLDRPRPFPHSENCLRLAADDELSKRWGKYEDAKAQYKQNRRNASHSIMTMLKSCSTIATLSKRWPEAVPFIPVDLQAQAPSTALAIPIPTLNAMLGLP